MRTRKNKKEGGGIYKKLLNFLSGRKTARRKGLQSTKLNTDNEKRKKQLKKKWFKTKKNKEELARLEAKLGVQVDKELIRGLKRYIKNTGNAESREKLQKIEESIEPAYEKLKTESLSQRSLFQKFFNRFYTPQQIQKPTLLEAPPIEGLLQVKENYRQPLTKENLKKSNNSIPEPQDLWEKVERNVNGQRMMLPREPMMFSLPRSFSFLYEKAFGTPIQNPGKISEEEFNRLRARVVEVGGERQPKNVNASRRRILKIAEEVFHMPVANPGSPTEKNLQNFDNEILMVERGKGTNKANYKIVTGPNGKLYISEQYLAHLGRFDPFIMSDYKHLQYALEYELYQCAGINPENNLRDFNQDFNYHRKPLSTLKSNLCISLGQSKELIYEQRDTNALRSNWLILDPKYFPEISDNPFKKKDLTAKYFTKASFIQDALDNWGIQGMDTAFLELLQTKYPEMAIKISTFLVSTKDYAYQMEKLKFNENFLIVDKNIFDREIALTILYPFSEESSYSKMLRLAIRRNKLFGMSPYMAYIMKKKNMTLWKEGFETTIANVYELLNPYEKITIDYLQYIRFMSVLEDSNFNFQEAHRSYNTFHEDIREILQLFKEAVPKHKRELKFFQSLVERQFTPEQTKTLIQDIPQIEALLSKFDVTALQRRTGRTEKTRKTFAPVQARSNRTAKKQERNALLRNKNLVNQETMTRKTRNQIEANFRERVRQMNPATFKNMLNRERKTLKTQYNKNVAGKNVQTGLDILKEKERRLKQFNENTADRSHYTEQLKILKEQENVMKKLKRLEQLNQELTNV